MVRVKKFLKIVGWLFAAVGFWFLWLVGDLIGAAKNPFHEIFAGIMLICSVLLIGFSAVILTLFHMDDEDPPDEDDDEDEEEGEETNNVQ